MKNELNQSQKARFFMEIVYFHIKKYFSHEKIVKIALFA